ncbi:MAG: hypothetical protein KDJ38_09365 [Gammaproteobacteria bacterium]|nr:hypothetical protein [Gammaproteobacteria bacterium]
MKRFFIFALATAIIASPISASACSTCLCGDPTLTLMGAEKPYAGRKRVSLEYLARSETLGLRGVDRLSVDEQRLSLGLSWTINQRVSLSLRLPFIDKQVETANLAQIDTQALGDIDLLARLYLQGDTGMSKGQYGLTLGLRLPSAEEQTSASGEPFDIDAQPGVGAYVPQLGVWYSSFSFPWLLHTSSTVLYSTEGDQDFKPGTAVTLTVLGQYATDYRLAWQLGLDSRWSEKDEYAGEPDGNSGGWFTFVTPGLVFTLLDDLLLNARVQVPLVDSLNGRHDEDTTFNLGITYDF